MNTLKDDVLGPGVARIAEYAPDNERRIRHLIAKHDFPYFQRGQKIYSRKTWLDRYYSGLPIETNGGAEK